jgi:hypothetical protein
VIDAPFAHIGALPIEETLGSFAPALLVAVGVARAQLRASVRRARDDRSRQAALNDESPLKNRRLSE